MSNLKRYTLYILNMIDIASFLLAYFPAYLLAFSSLFRGHSVYGTIQISLYIQFLLFVIVSYVLVNILFLYNDDRYLYRNFYEEFAECIKLTVYIILLILLFFYLTKTSVLYSRMFIGFYSVFFLFIDFFLREFVKKTVLPRFQKGSGAEKVLVMASSADIEKLIIDLKDTNDWRFQIIGAVVTDSDDKGAKYLGVPVIADNTDPVESYLDNDFDSVLYDPGNSSSKEIKELLKDLNKYGKTIHLKLHQYSLGGSFVSLDSIGNTSVMSYKAVQPTAKRKMIIKHILERLLCILLLPLLIAFAVLALVNNIFFSKGPLFTHYLRLGQNGRRFYLLRFRTMHLDAAERIRQGRSPYTGLGKLYMFFHIDGLPQIWNVISREMSLVGPRPIMIREYFELYPEDRVNYTVDPGIVGYWSIDEDQEKARRAFRDSQSRWSLLNDLFVIALAVGRFVTGRSLRNGIISYEKETVSYCTEQSEIRKPMEYEAIADVPKANPLYLIIKRLIDIILSAAGIIILSPLLIILTFLVIADDGGSPLYAHTRIGQHGKKINIYKFRSMRKDSGDLKKLLTPEQLAQYHREFKIDNDPRITRIGNFIRKTSLDELPQMFNILKGDMSIIGPRPLVEEEVRVNYSNTETARLLSVKPGLTGYWQAYARNNAVYETHERQDMELYYTDHRNLLFDIRIFFKTIVSVLKEEGAQ